MELRDGRTAEGTALLQRMLADDPGRRDALVILGCSVAEVNVDAGFDCIEVAARAAIAAGEWGSAAAAVNEFVSRVPNHVPALTRLVQICVDGGLEATVHSAQVQLVDAYLAAGAGLDARVVAEQVVAREPWDRANIERFRRALALLGEEHIDAVIAERLSGQTPFTSQTVLYSGEPSVEPPRPSTSMPPSAPAAPPADAGPAAGDLFSLSADSIELKRILGALEPEPPQPARTESHEVDLSLDLQDLKSGQEGLTAAKPAPLEDVLKGMRDQAVHDASPETAEQHFKLASTYLQMGMQDDAIKALEVSARSPRHRFKVGAMLAKLYLDRGDRAHAIEWYERALQAPAPDPASAHALLYDLAVALEAEGESARALAVLLELQAEAGDYRDMAVKLEYLTKAQMGS
jgi:tetratricopeptide (TPR) repeat protein